MSLTRQVLEESYAELETRLYNFALRWVWSPALAEELVQEAYVKVWQRRDRVDSQTLKALLYKIVQNLALSERRKELLRRKFAGFGWLLGETKFDAEQLYADEQAWQTLRRAVEALPDELREVLLLCEFSDLSYDEIAGILSIPSGTVASRKNRAMNLLKQWRKKGELSSNEVRNME